LLKNANIPTQTIVIVYFISFEDKVQEMPHTNDRQTKIQDLCEGILAYNEYRQRVSKLVEEDTVMDEDWEEDCHGQDWIESDSEPEFVTKMKEDLLQITGR